MIFILTDSYDIHADLVIKNLVDSSIDYFRFNLDTSALKNSKISFKNGVWHIQQNSHLITSNDIDVVWARRGFVELTLEELNDNSTGFQIWKNEWNKTLNGFYSTLKNKKWLNKLDKAYKGENKYLQMEIAEHVGFNLPPILISNEKNELLSFVEKHETVVFKMMAQDFYQSDKGIYEGLYVNIINSMDIIEKFNTVGENPIVLQKYIPKSFEVRYTVVGCEHFVCKIDSQKSNKANVDWRRYDIPNTPHIPINPPKEIKDKVNQLLSIFDLNYGALDFIVTPNNEWYFLEINCFGQWLWIEDLTGLEISKEISKWLITNVKEVNRT
ncbi:MvdC/MvdD family ATP grasp protein [Solibacillus sp. FSL R7-0668]|uniref:MvdC/MvdD family ATP grasp protein n=1 Tax=Solibacillus sp. FSL R7-0668 TaxID=2921688 RepID=UPI0030FBBC4A